MEPINRTFDLDSTMADFSFHGFTNTDIFADSIFIIQPKSLSTTVAVNPEIYDCFIQELDNRYGAPEDKGRHGHIYRAMVANDENIMERVTITCYSSTHNLSIQGSLHYIWTSRDLYDIERHIRKLNLSLTPSQHPTMCTSTPEPASMSQHMACTSTDTSSVVSDAELDSDTSPELDSDTSPELDSDTSAVMADEPTSTTSATVTSMPADLTTSAMPTVTEYMYVDVPSIPTRNSYCILEVEDIPDVTDDDDLPPIPLPWKCSKKSTPVKLPPQHQPSPKPMTSTKCLDVSTQQSPTCTSTSRTFTRPPVRNTILVLGDSMPKNLVGRRMSRRYRVLNRCIPGTSLEIWTKLAPVFVEEETPTAVIIHCGTNNIYRTLPMESITTMETLITAIRNMNSSTQILISSLIVQKHRGHYYWIAEFNARLHDLCVFHDCTFVDNSNISFSHLAADGLHLNEQGTLTLARNYISLIQRLPCKDFQMCAGNRTVK